MRLCHRKLWAVVLFFAAVWLHAQSPSPRLKPIKDNLYQIENVSGGNIVVLVGTTGVLMVDTGTDPEQAPLIDAAITEVTALPVKTIINTHWHHDHVKGNAYWAKKGATIVGHEKMAQRLKEETHMVFFGNTRLPLEEAAWPTEIVTESKAIRFDGQKIDLLHLGPGHTDGDLVVVFNDANVIHLGDLFFNGMYPYIGVSSGGNINGMIDNVNWILKELDGQAVVVPGHGPLSNKTELAAYVQMLTTVRDRIAPLVAQGKTLETIQAAKPTADLDDPWGKAWLDGDAFVRLVVMNLQQL